MAKRTGANGRKKRLERTHKRRIIGRFVLVALVLLALAAGGGALLHRTGVLRIAPFAGGLFRSHAPMVTAMTVAGSTHVTAGQIMDRLGFHFPMPYPAMKKTFAKEWEHLSPWIAAAILSGPHEGSVTVVITERKPVAIAAKAAVCFVDTTGEYIPFDARVAQHLPLVSGLRDSACAEGRRHLTNEDLRIMNRFLGGLAAFDPQIASRVTQMHFGPHGSVDLWLEGSATEIALDGNNLENGLERLMQLLPSVRSDSGFPLRIDLSCRNLAFVTTGGSAGDGAGKARQKG
jgi:hypothetical protein